MTDARALVNRALSQHGHLDRCARSHRQLRVWWQMSVVSNVVYRQGRRHAAPESLTATWELLRQPAAMAWIDLLDPDENEIMAVASEFGIHALAVEDAMDAHQRPKLERYAHIVFLVLRCARHVESRHRVEFAELHVFIGDNFVTTVRQQAGPDLRRVRHGMEKSPAMLTLGPEAILYAILDQVVDEYGPVVDQLEARIDAIEDQVFAGQAEASQRIYEALRDVTDFQRATHPLLAVLSDLRADYAASGMDLELQHCLRNVEDHVIHVVDRIDAFRAILQDILTVNATLVAQRQNEEARQLTAASLVQNEEVKRISSWAAILFAPTLIGSIYGMNFANMPELGWSVGYPAAITAMAVASASLYLLFRRRNWL